jgi:cold shock CspA family protein
VAQDYTSVVFADALSDVRNTPSSRKRIEGWVEDFYPDKMYGFIRHAPRNGIFVSISDVTPDVVGRRFLKPGTLVSFELTESRGRFRALNVKDESLELLNIDPENYEETSYVEDWRGGYGFLVRPNGERLYFHRNKVITVGQELLKSWDGVNDPCWVTHRIDHTLHAGKNRFFATDIQILEPTQPTIEDVFLNATELPVEVPEPVAAPPSSVLAPETKNLTLLEIIQQRRTGQGK